MHSAINSNSAINSINAYSAINSNSANRPSSAKALKETHSDSRCSSQAFHLLTVPSHRRKDRRSETFVVMGLEASAKSMFQRHQRNLIFTSDQSNLETETEKKFRRQLLPEKRNFDGDGKKWNDPRLCGFKKIGENYNKLGTRQSKTVLCMTVENKIVGNIIKYSPALVTKYFVSKRKYV